MDRHCQQRYKRPRDLSFVFRQVTSSIIGNNFGVNEWMVPSIVHCIGYVELDLRLFDQHVSCVYLLSTRPFLKGYSGQYFTAQV